MCVKGRLGLTRGGGPSHNPGLACDPGTAGILPASSRSSRMPRRFKGF